MHTFYAVCAIINIALFGVGGALSFIVLVRSLKMFRNQPGSPDAAAPKWKFWLR